MSVFEVNCASPVLSTTVICLCDQVFRLASRPCMAAPVNLVGVGAYLAELWLLRGHACPACPPCLVQTCTLTCSGPATSHTEPHPAALPSGGPGWLTVWLAAALGAGLAWAVARWGAGPGAASSAPEAPAPERTASTSAGPVTPSQLAKRS